MMQNLIKNERSFWNEKWVKGISDFHKQIKREREAWKWTRKQKISGQTGLDKFVLKYRVIIERRINRKSLKRKIKPYWFWLKNEIVCISKYLFVILKFYC